MTVINTIFNTDWNLSRWLRLAIGVSFLGDALYEHSEMSAILGILLVFQAIFSWGCGTSSCSVGNTHKKLGSDSNLHSIKINKK